MLQQVVPPTQTGASRESKSGLPEGAANARMKGVSGRITVRSQASAPLLEPWNKLVDVRHRDRIIEKARGPGAP